LYKLAHIQVQEAANSLMPVSIEWTNLEGQ